MSCFYHLKKVKREMQRSSPLVSFNYTYLAEEADYEIDVWTSASFGRGQRITQRIRLSADDGNSISGNATFRAGRDEKYVFRLDDAIHFMIYQYKSTDKGGEDLLLPSGSAYVYVAELLTRKEGVTVPVRIASLTAWPVDEGNAARGRITVTLRLPDVSPTFLPGTGCADLIPYNMPCIEDVLMAEVEKTIALGNAEAQMQLQCDVNMLEVVMARVRARYYSTGILPHVPGYIFFRPWDRMNEDDLSAIENHMQLAVRRYGWRLSSFSSELDNLLDPRLALTLEQALALDTVALGFSLLCHAMLYVADYAPNDARRGWKSGMRIVECFEDVLRRKQGDCEDFARLICTLVFLSTSRVVSTKLTILTRVKRLMRYYVNAACLMTVEGAKLGDGDEGGLDLRHEDGAGSHMQNTQFLRDDFLSMIRKINPDAYLPKEILGYEYRGETAAEKRVLAKLPPLQLEGTGNMFALQRLKPLLTDPKELERYIRYVDNQELAFGILADPDSVQNAAHSRSAGVELHVPSWLRPWKVRRMPHNTDKRTTPLNDFYRSYRLAMLYTEEECAIKTRRGTWSFNSIDIGTSLNLDECEVPFTVGAPSFDIASRRPCSMATLVPPSSEEFKEVMARWRTHMCPAVPLTMPTGHTEQQRSFLEALRSALGCGCGTLEQPMFKDVELLTLTLCWRDCYKTNVPILGAHIRANSNVLRVSVHMDEVFDDLVVFVMLLHIKMP